MLRRCFFVRLLFQVFLLGPGRTRGAQANGFVRNFLLTEIEEVRQMQDRNDAVDVRGNILFLHGLQLRGDRVVDAICSFRR